MSVRFRLSNGLTVVFEEQHSAKVAAFQAWVKVGSADERPDQAGLAHLHEHMLFKGTSRRGPGQIAQEVESRGGEINAWTSFDQTVYHVVLASRFAGLGIDVLSDALRHSAFDPAELAREIEVVCEEIKRSDDMPSRRASRDLFATAFQVHPYHRPVIGWESTVRSFTREKVVDFYRRYYSPENMVLSIAGDLSESAVRGCLRDTFEGDWQRPFIPPDPRPAEPWPEQRRILLKEEDVKEVHLHLGFHIPSVEHPDVPALDMLATLMGQGEASRLVLQVKRQRSSVNDIRAFAYTPRDPGLLSVSLTSRAETAAEALAQTVRVVTPLCKSPVPSGELASVKALLESEAIYQRETVQGQARRLGFYEAGAGGIEREAQYYDRIARTTAEEIRATAEKYLRFDRAVLTGLLPTGTGLTPEQAEEILDRAVSAEPISPARSTRRPPPPSPPGSVVAEKVRPNIVIERLPSGGQLIVLEERSTPLFAIRASFLGGVRYETDENSGLTTLLARMLIRGTPSRDAEEISGQIEQFSGSMSGQAGRNSVSLRGEFLSRHFERAFALFADCLLLANFPESEFRREQALQLQDIVTRDENPAGVALDLFARTLFQHHPYRLSPMGERASVERQTPDDLGAYHLRYLDPSQMSLCVVGDVKAERVIAFAQDAFATSRMPASPVPVPQETDPSAPRTSKKALNRAQCHVVLGFLGVRVTDTVRFPVQVLAALLSGQGGRLFLELRDKKSLAYSVSSFSVEGVDPGYFATYLATSPHKLDTALEGIRAELTRISSEPIPEAELERAKQNLIGTHEIGLQRNGARAALLALDHCYGVGLENFSHYSERIEAVTADEVGEIAKRILRLDRSSLAIVGP